MPGARRDEAADLVQALDFGHELSLGHGLQQGLTLLLRQGLQVVNPDQFMALAVEDGKARFGVRNGKGPHHHHLFVNGPIGELQHPHPKRVTPQQKWHTRGLFGLGQGGCGIGIRGSLGVHRISCGAKEAAMATRSASCCRAWASYKR